LLYALLALQQKQIVQAESLLLPLLPVFHNSTPVTIPNAIPMSAIANRTKIAFMNIQDEALWVLRYLREIDKVTQVTDNLEKVQLELAR